MPAGIADDGPLAIICGGGSLPFAVADAVAPAGRRVVLFPLRGWADPAACRRLSASLGVARPTRRVSPDRAGRKAAAMWSSSARWCDRRSAQLWLDLADAAGVAADHPAVPRRRRSPAVGHRRGSSRSTASGCVGAARGRAGNPDAGRRARPLAPTERDRADIARGLGAAARDRPVRRRSGARWSPTITCWRSRRRRAPTGCSRASRSCAGAAAFARPRAGVLVKAPKPGRTAASICRSIGPQTVDGVARAGLAGIAVVAGERDHRRARSESRRRPTAPDCSSSACPPIGIADDGRPLATADAGAQALDVFLVAGENPATGSARP